jgi:hypothetical protein
VVLERPHERCLFLNLKPKEMLGVKMFSINKYFPVEQSLVFEMAQEILEMEHYWTRFRVGLMQKNLLQ